MIKAVPKDETMLF